MLSRRQFMAGIGVSGICAFLPFCRSKESGKEVTAVEDLMREHGVLRRILFVYSEVAERSKGSSLDSQTARNIQKAAQLFRAFGEEYHEKQLEEAYLFPVVLKAGGETAHLINPLIEQHNRGRQITEYIINSTVNTSAASRNRQSLIHALQSFVRMYRPHAAREDTVVFPVWKDAITEEQMREMNDKFEDIERRQFGEDGFEKAVRQISAIETELGFFDLTRFTPPSPES